MNWVVSPESVPTNELECGGIYFCIFECCSKDVYCWGYCNPFELGCITDTFCPMRVLNPPQY